MPVPTFGNTDTGTTNLSTQGYGYDPNTGIYRTNDGWGGVKEVNTNGEVQSVANKLSKELGISPEAALKYAKEDAARYFSQPNANPNNWALTFWGSPGYEALKKRVQGTEAENAANSQAAADQAAADQRTGITNQIQAFVNSMLGPMDPNDPVHKGLVQMGTNAAQASAGRGGLSGRSGLAGTQAASVAQANALPYLQARSSLGLQAQGLLNNRDLGLGQLNQDWAKFMTDRNDRIAGLQAGAQQQQNSMIGSLIGGGLGALGFIGGPALGSATMGAGASLGGSIGGGFSRPPQYGAPASRYGSMPSSIGGPSGTGF